MRLSRDFQFMGVIFANLIRGEIGACIEHRFEAKIKQIVEMEVLKTHIEKLKVDDTWAIVLHAAVEGEHIMKMIESMVTDKKQSQRYQIYGIEYAARHLGKFYFSSYQRSTSVYFDFACYNCN